LSGLSSHAHAAFGAGDTVRWNNRDNAPPRRGQPNARYATTSDFAAYPARRKSLRSRRVGCLEREGADLSANPLEVTTSASPTEPAPDLVRNECSPTSLRFTPHARRSEVPGRQWVTESELRPGNERTFRRRSLETSEISPRGWPRIHHAPLLVETFFRNALDFRYPRLTVQALTLRAREPSTTS